jgi:hypothetical protein
MQVMLTALIRLLLLKPKPPSHLLPASKTQTAQCGVSLVQGFRLWALPLSRNTNNCCCCPSTARLRLCMRTAVRLHMPP